MKDKGEICDEVQYQKDLLICLKEIYHYVRSLYRIVIRSVILYMHFELRIVEKCSEC